MTSPRTASRWTRRARRLAAAARRAPVALWTTERIGVAIGVLLAIAIGNLGCAAGGCSNGEGYRAVGCRAAEARDQLVYGLSREQALDAIGRSEVDPPWSNPLGAGPAAIRNPFDSQTYTSSLGEEYEVVRYFVKAYGNPDCPFIQGRLMLEPLIFVDGRLVGWRWSYLEDVLERRLSEEEVGWSFGTFCD